MRFVAKRAKEGINVSDTNPLIEAGALVAGLTAIFVAIALLLVFLIEVALYFVSAEDEANLFADWLPNDFVSVSHADDRLRETQLLVDRLAHHWPDSPYQFRVEVDDSEQANAMALPGGLIIVTQGLLDQVESENELAFVLGHELGHFKNRDHLRALGRGIVLSMFFAVVTGNDFGLAIVHAEYGHVNEAWRLFERWEITDNSFIDLVTYLSTHPETGDRIADMRSHAQEKGWRSDGEITPLSW